MRRWAARPGRRAKLADGLSGDGGYSALFEGLAALEVPRDVVRVAGPDAERYLQGQLSQDLTGFGEGSWAWSLVLQPQGRLVAFVRVYRAGATEFLLDTDAGPGPALTERLLRFKLRTKADIEQLAWRSVAVRGPGAVRAFPEESAHGPGPGAGASEQAAVAVPFTWHSLTGYDLLGPAPAAPAGAVAVSVEAYEAARIEAGFPRHGAELEERTIPAEAGLVEVAVSFTKGCYTGQELVARIDARGSHVPRNLRGLTLEGPAEPGARLYEAPGGGKEVGTLTSVARSPRLGWVGLGYVRRGTEPGQAVYLGAGSRSQRGLVRLLPFGTPAP